MSRNAGPVGARRFRSAIIDRYLLTLVAKPLGLSLGVVMIALLLERLLRLIDLLASTGGGHYEVLAMLTASLVPHYLGLALSAAFVVALFVAMSRLGNSSELDALLASGLSLWRITLPFVFLGGILAIFSLGLYGYLNPISRYDYRKILYTALQTVEQAQIPPGTFVHARNGLTVTADAVDVTGGSLEGVFILQRREGELERITTARKGQLVLAADGQHFRLVLEDGVSTRENVGQAPIRLQFKRLNFETEFDLGAQSFRPRGNSERELTFSELWQEIRTPSRDLTPPILKAELVDRIVRSLAFPFLPLLAIPLSLASRRGSRATGLIFAAIFLVTFNNALQLGGDLAASGYGVPVLTAAAPFLVFAGCCIWIFVSSARHPTQAPLVRVFERVTSMARFVARRAGRAVRPA